VILAFRPFQSESEASDWVASAAAEGPIADLLDDALATLERALAAEAAATGRPYVEAIGPDDVIGAKVGYGDGDRVSEGLYLEALEIDARGGTAGERRERMERNRPVARIAAILGDRETAAACEFLIPRVRSDLDCGRVMSAALVIEVAVRSTIVEMDSALDDSGHSADLDRLRALLPELTGLTESILAEGRAWRGLAEALEEPLAVAERIMRRRRALEQ
jgi:hypothetical protein